MKHFNRLFFLFTFSFYTLTVTAQWQPKSSGVTSGVIHCFIESSGVLFAGGNKAGIYSSEDNGNTWILSNTGVSARDEILCFGKNSSGLFAAQDTIYFCNNNGASWSAVNTDGKNTWSLAFLSDTVFAPSFNGGVRMSPDNGATWTWVNTGLPTTDNIASIISSGNILFVATYNNGVYMSSDAGVSWSAVNNGLQSPYAAYEIVRNGTQLYVATNDGLYTSTNNASLWTKVTSTKIGSITFVGNTMIANAGYGKVVRSTDGGLTWTDFTTGIDTTYTYGIAGFYPTSTYVYCGIEGGTVPIYRINRSEVLSVQKPEPNLICSAYPNPFNSTFTLNFDITTKCKIQVENMLGEKVYESDFTGWSSTIDLDGISSGVYNLRIVNTQNAITKKLIKN